MLKKESLISINDERDVLAGNEKYAYLLPCKKLQQWVSNFTLSFPDQESISDEYTILPHGSVTLVFFSNATGLHSLLYGATTQPKIVGELANQCDVIFIIEFQPAGFFPFSKISQNEWIDKVLNFSLINSEMDLKIKRMLKEEESVDRFLVKVEKILLENIRAKYPVELTSAMDLIIQARGTLSANEIAHHVSYSNRQLNRFFNQYLGLSVKSFTRIVRVNHALRHLNGSRDSITSISSELDYYDTSHFIKDFKIVCGITPYEYRVNMSDFYSEIAKF